MKKNFIIILFIVLTLLRVEAKSDAALPSSKVGLLWTSWSVDHYATYPAYIAKLQAWGIEYVSLNPTYFINTYAEGIVTDWSGTTVTPDLMLQKNIVKELIKKKFYINYRPHVDPIKFAMPMGDARNNWNTIPGGTDWRGLFNELNPTSATIGYRSRIILPALNMLAQAIREAGAPVTPIRFDLGAELMNSMLNYPQQWIDLRVEVQQLLNSQYNDVKQHISLSHNFCHHIEYLLRIPRHDDFATRVAADQKLDKSLLFIDRPGVTPETRLAIGRYIAGLNEMSISQYMPLDIFRKGSKTNAEEVKEALLYHEKNFVEEVLVKECGIKPQELPVLHIGEYGMGWRGLAAPNVWDRAEWIKAGNGHMMLSDEQQKEDAAIAIEGILKYVQEDSGTNFRSFLLWFGGAPYDLLNINDYSAWSNPLAASMLKNYWTTHKGVPTITKPTVTIDLSANAGADITVYDVNDDGVELIALDTSLSTANNATIISYEWMQNGNTISTRSNFSANFNVGTHILTLKIKDDKERENVDVLIVNVLSTSNNAPIANAGADQFANDFDNDGVETFTLDASASTDTDGSIISYSWSLNAVVLSTSINPTVALPVGTHTLVLTVVDNKNAVAYEDIIVNVNAVNAAASTIDDFETYTSNAALTAAWTINADGRKGNCTRRYERHQYEVVR